MNRKLFPFIVASLFMALTTACGQKTVSLTTENLKKATSISYYTDNGSVPPEYHWSMTLTVTPKQVKLKVVKGYDGKVAYSKKQRLTPAQYKQFLGKINKLSIKKKKFNGEPAVGGDSEYLCVKVGSQKVFDANDEELVYKGDLHAVFHDLLPNEMAQVFRHPDDL